MKILDILISLLVAILSYNLSGGSLPITIFVVLVLFVVTFRDKIQNKISNSGRKLTFGKALVWLFVSWLLLSSVFLFLQWAGLVSPNLASCDPENIGLDGSKIFENGKDGQYSSLNLTEQEKYSVIVFPDEGRIVLRGGSDGEVVPIFLGIHRYPFKTVGIVEKGPADTQILLKDTKEKVYYSAHSSFVKRYTFAAYKDISFVFSDINLKIGSYVEPVNGLSGNSYGVYVTFNVPANTEIIIKGLEVKR